jgi:hypothetical protein
MVDTTKLPVIAPEDVMSQKKHGTSDAPVMKDLRWKCDFDTADRICNFNRHYAEFAGKSIEYEFTQVHYIDPELIETTGYWATTEFLKYVKDRENPDEPIEFYDSVTGKLLFTAPVGRTMQEFLLESNSHGRF